MFEHPFTSPEKGFFKGSKHLLTTWIFQRVRVMDDVRGAQKHHPLNSKQNPWGEDAGRYLWDSGCLEYTFGPQNHEK